MTKPKGSTVIQFQPPVVDETPLPEAQGPQTSMFSDELLDLLEEDEE